jgi:hypothetical protein
MYLLKHNLISSAISELLNLVETPFMGYIGGVVSDIFSVYSERGFPIVSSRKATNEPRHKKYR